MSFKVRNGDRMAAICLSLPSMAIADVPLRGFHRQTAEASSSLPGQLLHLVRSLVRLAGREKETPALFSYPVIQVSSPAKLLLLSETADSGNRRHKRHRGSLKSLPAEPVGILIPNRVSRLRRRWEEADKITSAGCNVIPVHLCVSDVLETRDGESAILVHRLRRDIAHSA